MLPIDELLAGARAHRQKTGRPLVTLSYAQSLDGSIAARRDSPLRLSGPEAMALTHRLRAAHDGILAGIGTVLADDPRLNVRLADGRDPQPVVLDSRLNLPLDARLLGNNRLPWIAALQGADPQKQRQLEQRGARILILPAGQDGRISLPALLDCLAELGLNSLMVEGGASVITSFLAQGLVDRLVLTVAPVIVGGLRAVDSEAAFPMRPQLKNPGYERLGDDLIVWGKFIEQ
jgi:3,4-dihydroxy 2-butanone 4-phosphate synthase/GTP cyclohydrolase II